MRTERLAHSRDHGSAERRRDWPSLWRPAPAVHRRPDERGAAALELALVLPLLVMLLFGGIMFAITWFRYQGMQAAAREGGRVAAIHATYAEVQASVCDSAGAYFVDSVTELNLTVAGSSTGWTGCAGTLAAGAGMSTGAPCNTHEGDSAQLDFRLSDVSAGEWSVPFWDTISSDFHSSAIFRCEG